MFSIMKDKTNNDKTVYCCLACGKICFSFVIVTTALIAILSYASSVHAKQYVLCAPVNPNQSGLGPEFMFIRKAFENIGAEVEFTALPVERCDREANAGKLDGVCGKIDGLQGAAGFEHLLKVPSAVYIVECSAWSIRSDITLNGILDLDNYKVAYVQGIRFIEILLEDRISGDNVFAVTSHEQLYRILLAKRVDIVLNSSLIGKGVLSRPEFKDKGIRELETSLGSRTIHVYMHEKHKQMIPALSESLDELKSDGTYKRLLGVDPPE